ncbi:Otoancorin [Frankliniella fusca]|uniref:Otoancorin n=1 Tax=Frankliniella fusca TaxID=407009 RepID=A0AAE1L951_9NEOP|nr:Otoancorin [Frankliniella fusca]
MRPRKKASLLTLLVLASYLISDTEEAVAPAAPAAAPTQTDTLVCGLQHGGQDQQCGDSLPDRLVALVDGPDVPDQFRTAAKTSNFSAIEPTVLANIPVLVLYHLSPYFLSTCSAPALSAVIRNRPKDPVLARTVLSALDFVDNEKRVRFIRELGVSSGLSAEVQGAIGEAAVRWWAHDMTEFSLDLAAAGTPLLAALPPGYLAELQPQEVATMLMRLRNHHWNERNDPKWSEQPTETKRVWMDMFKRDADSGKGQLVNSATDGLKMLWAGATPDEIADLQFHEEDRATLTALSGLSKLQVRAFVDKLYTKKALSSAEMNELFKWMLDLAPAGLQRFLANDTDFTSLPAADTSRASVLEQVVASSLFQGRIEIPDHPGTWGRYLKDVGRLTYLIQAATLANYSLPTHRLDPDVLAAVDTYKLSAMQARYLTNKGEFLDLRKPLRELEAYHGLTRAMPTAKLAALKTNSVSNEKIIHFLESIPATHSGRSASLFNKLRQSMAEPKVLEAMLRNPEPAQYWSLVSSRELAAERTALEQSYNQLKSPSMRKPASFGDWFESTITLNPRDSIEKHLPLVPTEKLSAVLGSARRELAQTPSGPQRVVWSTDTLLSPRRPLVRGALLGLTCADVMAMDLVDFPIIMAEFNQRTREAGLPFPKRLQHCLQLALEEYMVMRRRIRRFDERVPLVAVLEPSDIQAVGGYLLATLRPAHIHYSKHAVQILSSIGALTPQELLSAMPSLERLRELALHVVDIFQARRGVGARCLFALGNLHMFLPADVVSSIMPDAWRLYVEASAGRPLSLATCAGSEQRDAWHRLALRTFGSPSQWSAGVVAALGDTLASMPADVLASVRQTSWRDAADTLAARMLYHLPCGAPEPGSGRPRPFVDVCRSLLPAEERSAYYWSVRRTARHYLRAAQDLLNTVTPADSLVRRLQARSFRSQFESHYRHATASSSTSTKVAQTTITTTTTAPTTPEAETTPASTTTTTTTTTEDPFGDFDEYLGRDPDWMRNAAEPPDTVMVVDDETSLSTSTTTEPSTTTTTTSVNISTVTDYPAEGSSVASTASDPTTTVSVPVDEGMYERWPETTSITSVPTSSSTDETTLATARSDDKADLPSALDLPHLYPSAATYPNQSRGAPGHQVNLSTTTTKYSTETDAPKNSKTDVPVSTDATVTVDPNSEVKRDRRRRSADYDQVEAENERQVERDVPLQVTCDAVRALGGAAELALVHGDAGDGKGMLETEVEECVEDLSRLHLAPGLTRTLWDKIPPLERADLVGDLGRLVSAVSVDEVSQLNLSLSHERALDTLSVLGEHVSDPAVLDAVAVRLELQNPGLRALAGSASPAGSRRDTIAVEPDSLLVALGPIACHLRLDLQRLLLGRRGALLHAAHSLQGVAPRCNSTCLGELARAAVSDAVLGAPAQWTAEDVTDIGVIAAGLNSDQLSQLQRPLAEVEQPLSGLTASAVSCMSPEQLVALGDHVGVLSPVAAAAVTPLQQQDMTSNQQAALLRVRNLAFTRHLGKGDQDPEGYHPSAASCTRQPPAVALLALLVLLAAF